MYFLGDTVEKCSYSSRKCLKKVSAVLLVAKMHTILQNVFSSAEIFLAKSQRTICTFVANKKNTLHFEKAICLNYLKHASRYSS